MEKTNTFKSDKIDYSTPIKLFEYLNNEFHFNIDVCANASNAKCSSYFTEEQDGLKQDWTGVCWMNPPFNKELKKWVIKARDELILCLG